jgi:carbonic anhydrase
MTKIADEVLAANAKYAESFGDKANLPLPPSRNFAILTVWMRASIQRNMPV